MFVAEVCFQDVEMANDMKREVLDVLKIFICVFKNVFAVKELK